MKLLDILLNLTSLFQSILDMPEDVSWNVDDGSCVYPRSPASVLCVFAAIFLFTAQIIISVGANCFCCCGVRCVSRCTTIASLILFVLSWVSFFKAFVQFIGTAILNNSNYLSRKHSTTCYVETRRLIFRAAIWCIITLILSLSSYAFYACTSEAQHRNVNLQGTAGSDVGVAMGQPHMRHMQMSKDQC
ncbi:uncharacterized protein LOC130805428 [Amaranthus tricolor]|uniref:uncharacterized protein LOC130805428 n=1 Tax=Amaranthus tricolor TaxID=29722 RepID=UPI00258AC709|nr:uncharacterized protein LOC130805428 [Amaranthus tricolor]